MLLSHSLSGTWLDETTRTVIFTDIGRLRSKWSRLLCFSAWHNIPPRPTATGKPKKKMWLRRLDFLWESLVHRWHDSVFGIFLVGKFCCQGPWRWFLWRVPCTDIPGYQLRLQRFRTSLQSPPPHKRPGSFDCGSSSRGPSEMPIIWVNYDL